MSHVGFFFAWLHTKDLQLRVTPAGSQNENLCGDFGGKPGERAYVLERHESQVRTTGTLSGTFSCTDNRISALKPRAEWKPDDQRAPGGSTVLRHVTSELRRRFEVWQLELLKEFIKTQTNIPLHHDMITHWWLRHESATFVFLSQRRCPKTCRPQTSQFNYFLMCKEHIIIIPLYIPVKTSNFLPSIIKPIAVFFKLVLYLSVLWTTLQKLTFW